MHQPVLLKETIALLDPKPGEFIIDGTIGSGGHAAKIFEKILPQGKLIGIDLDKDNLKKTESKILAEIKNEKDPPGSAAVKIKNNLILIQGNYADLPEILQSAELRGLNADKRGKRKVDGLLLDLGMSSEQIERSGRGFSFLRNEKLDMRYNHEAGSMNHEAWATAGEVINRLSEKELAEIFWKYGEERYSRRIAKGIVESRKRMAIKTTFDLVRIIRKSAPKSYEKGRIHPATRIFQALRIYINDELGNLERLLKNAPNILKSGGRAVIISFHSLEDRLVKNYFREMKKEGKAEILTKKPIMATREEVKLNPRSRSAKLRAIKFNYSTKFVDDRRP
ncbi:16S rRNA (cytosine(1402)-N(4))-methyltransferase RsmH [Candidatus Wolfebacteria bacterium]|nr:16S rRNA (cytosine(1402)-N(4))-methyltransferase RsmH [Candidatus Wolfebacteria bacterium]